MRARARIAMLIGVVVLLALFLLTKKIGEDASIPPRHDETNTATRAELPARDPANEGGTDAGTTEVARFGKGQLSGRITYGGLMPAPDMVDMRADPKCRHLLTNDEERLRRRIEVDDKGGLAGAVVWVEIDPELQYRPPSQPVQLHIKRCRFIPETIALQVGQKLIAINDDPILHNVHAITMLSEFNVALPKKGDRQERSLRSADTEGSFKCELHPWEQGRLYVFSHPFFAVTDSSGAFSIKHLPGSGPWHVFASHPHTGTKDITSGAGPIEIQLAEEAL